MRVRKLIIQMRAMGTVGVDMKIEQKVEFDTDH